MICANYKSLLSMFALVMNLILHPMMVNAADNSKEGNVTRGAKSWANNCARCHNMREPSEFRDDLWEPIVAHMRVRGGLTGQQARDIIAYLQSVNFTATAGSSVTGDGGSTGQSGEKIFKQTCIACHGADGKGAISGVPDLRTRLSKSDETLLQNIENGFQSPGSPMAMPPKGGNPDLNRADLIEVLEYIKTEFK